MHCDAGTVSSETFYDLFLQRIDRKIQRELIAATAEIDSKCQG